MAIALRSAGTSSAAAKRYCCAAALPTAIAHAETHSPQKLCPTMAAAAPPAPPAPISAEAMNVRERPKRASAAATGRLATAVAKRMSATGRVARRGDGATARAATDKAATAAASMENEQAHAAQSSARLRRCAVDSSAAARSAGGGCGFSASSPHGGPASSAGAAIAAPGAERAATRGEWDGLTAAVPLCCRVVLRPPRFSGAPRPGMQLGETRWRVWQHRASPALSS